jgi:GDP-mannose 6-dehydrogenase
MRISIFGLGYVGAVSSACLAKLGHTVIGVDVAQAKVDLLASGKCPIIEDGLPELITEMHALGRISATTDAVKAINETDVALVCVGTPSTKSGGVNATYLEAVCKQIGEAVRDSDKDFFTVLSRSTSMPVVHDRLVEILAESSGSAMGGRIGYVCHPEFLREGAAVADFFGPPKIVFGATDEKSREVCSQLYPDIQAESFYLDMRVAAMVKYADNCFHAVKVTFGNEIGMICREMDIDATAVMEVFCQDRKLNISPRYLRPGQAFGGSCLPKDMRAMLDMARQTATPLPMLEGMGRSNKTQIDALLARVISPERPRIGIIGLAFKEGTDDIRESPIVNVVEQLCGKGHPVKIYDAHLAVQSLVGANRSFALQSIPHLAELLSQDLQAVIAESDVVLISHRLSPEKWAGIKWGDQRVIDLAKVDSLSDLPRYEGLYW